MTAGRAWGWAAGVFGVVCLVLQLDSISCERKVVFGTVNESVTFNVQRSVHFKELLWTKSNDKVIEWEEGTSPHVFPPFENRVHLDTTSGTLTIFNLTSSDEAEYRIEPSSIDISFFLHVIDPLPSPTLNCTSTAEEITVRCRIPDSYNYTELLNYSWNCSSGLCENSSDPSEVLIKKESDLSQEIQCIVSIALSKQTSSLVLATCVPGGHSRHNFVIIPAVVVVAGVTFLLFRKACLKGGRKTERTEDDSPGREAEEGWKRTPGDACGKVQITAGGSDSSAQGS
ncbi:lymphocyte function-associated antigen 3 isoform X2 [Ursus arctos]|uniref:lymphocyte function-associated antigen 3 isoform X2 n=2 Tax=Ursus arctos TaxID=9644 RepID=UPI002017D700|nr:lymphocyte function-associated antigen 3 isoform X2 [Ursus arctos]